MKSILVAIKLVLCQAILAMLVVTCVGAAPRDRLSVPALDVYRATLKYQNINDLKKVRKSIDFLKVIVDGLDTKYEQNLYDEINDTISDEDSIKCGVLLVRLLFYDIQSLLEIGVDELGTSGVKAKKRFKTAYLEYLLIKKHVENKNFTASTKISKAFRAISQLIDKAGNAYSYNRDKSSTINIGQIEKLSKGIIHELGGIFME